MNQTDTQMNKEAEDSKKSQFWGEYDVYGDQKDDIYSETTANMEEDEVLGVNPPVHIGGRPLTSPHLESAYPMHRHGVEAAEVSTNPPPKPAEESQHTFAITKRIATMLTSIMKVPKVPNVRCVPSKASEYTQLNGASTFVDYDDLMEPASNDPASKDSPYSVSKVSSGAVLSPHDFVFRTEDPDLTAITESSEEIWTNYNKNSNQEADSSASGVNIHAQAQYADTKRDMEQRRCHKLMEDNIRLQKWVNCLTFGLVVCLGWLVALAVLLWTTKQQVSSLQQDCHPSQNDDSLELYSKSFP